LNLVMTAAVAGALGAEQDAAIRELAASQVELQVEIAIPFDRAQMACAVAAQNGAERLPGGLALHDLPLLEVAGSLIQALPALLGGQLLDAQIAKTDRISERLNSQVPAPQAVAQIRNRFHIEVLNRLAVDPDLQSRPIHQDAHLVPLALIPDV